MRKPSLNLCRLDLAEIERTLIAVEADFTRINRNLSMPRDPMTDEVRRNLMAGYRYVDDLLAKSTDLFGTGNSRLLLELNTLVLCGKSNGMRLQFAQHIKRTEEKFYGNQEGGIQDLMDWLEIHASDSVWKRAAGAYIHVLSQPQLFIEGNHRTGALIMSYILAREGYAPFVLSVANAKAYFDPSSLVRKTSKSSFGTLFRLPKLKKQFAKLLREQTDSRYLQRTWHR